MRDTRGAVAAATLRTFANFAGGVHVLFGYRLEA
jgi:hypothetical protein